MRTPTLGLLLLLLGACVSASGVRLGETPYDPRPEGHTVAVYDSTEDLPRSFVKVARIVGEGSEAPFAAVVEAMVAEARAFGADALVLTGHGTSVRGEGESGECDHRVHALAVRWRDG